MYVIKLKHLPFFCDDLTAKPLIEDGHFTKVAGKSNFLHLLKDNQELHFAFTKLLSERMRFKLMTIRELAYYNPEHRISTLLSQRTTNIPVRNANK
ncbi:hypothetical protein [Niastella yeongjuensis]|uniref:hypothetical protein n=1 Tax=Niastella yeongjuensis TaxID=354355 RepID=UPI001A98818F|nr:hypothetical protein [Niastella yeongjuensis]